MLEEFTKFNVHSTNPGGWIGTGGAWWRQAAQKTGDEAAKQRKKENARASQNKVNTFYRVTVKFKIRES